MEPLLNNSGVEQEGGNYNPGRLLDALADRLAAKNDAALSRALEVAPPVLSKIRHGRLPVGATILLRMHEASGIPIRELRDRCPCATCREKRNAPPPKPNLLQVLSAAETKPLTLTEFKPIGNYAYSIGFSDGHDTGIYTIEFLKELGTPN